MNRAKQLAEAPPPPAKRQTTLKPRQRIEPSSLPLSFLPSSAKVRVLNYLQL